MSEFAFKEVDGWKPLCSTKGVILEVSERITRGNYKAVIGAAKAFMASTGKEMTSALPVYEKNNLLEVLYKEQSSKKR